MNEQNFQPLGQKLPNATASLVLGILGILGTCCYVVPGLIMGIIGLILAGMDTKKYKANPAMYDNYSTVKTGKILSIIAIVISFIFIAFVVWMFAYIGWENMQNEELMNQRIEELFGQ
ncbi:CCC motif membrane protein [Frigoriflavimonas asaccharolytica]|uniref:Large-conductance mechanosensitive channel n=1 Tax=Frigoriflavimonas asaccharolytica TaxID=2735899 RepID=A0A8J8G8I4_9FLAO|nr:CCC motif membrane protein [Frigoriflavimonas asaccharolytica]NRS93083.1 large-conductance mechanosensitive channel [Frigoriflavimonas asaccharolytica]